MATTASADPHWRETYNRLLLARMLLRHGREHGEIAGTLNKMIAVHNVHNAVEIVLRTVLYYLQEPGVNHLAFPALLQRIEGTNYYQQNGLHIPLQVEIRTLNDMRNLVQHRAFEPSDVSRWVAFADSFLAQVCRDVFKVELADITPVDLVEDKLLRALLALAAEARRLAEVGKCVQASILAFQASAESILDFGDDTSQHETGTGETPFGPALGGFLSSFGFGAQDLNMLGFGFGDIARKIVRAERMSFLLASGVSIPDYKHYSRIEDKQPDAWQADDAEWINTFVTNAIVDWQTADFEPHVPKAWENRISVFLEAATSSTSTDSEAEPET